MLGHEGLLQAVFSLMDLSCITRLIVRGVTISGYGRAIRLPWSRSLLDLDVDCEAGWILGLLGTVAEDLPNLRSISLRLSTTGLVDFDQTHNIHSLKSLQKLTLHLVEAETMDILDQVLECIVQDIPPSLRSVVVSGPPFTWGNVDPSSCLPQTRQARPGILCTTVV